MKLEVGHKGHVPSEVPRQDIVPLSTPNLLRSHHGGASLGFIPNSDHSRDCTLICISVGRPVL